MEHAVKSPRPTIHPHVVSRHAFSIFAIFLLCSWLAPSARPAIEGYCWPISAAPGEVMEFKVSGTGPIDVTFLRQKADASGVVSIPVGSTNINASLQPVPFDPARN